MKPAVLQLRIMQICMIATVIVIIYISRTLAPAPGSPSASFQWGVVLIACLDAIAGFIVPRMMMRARSNSSPHAQSATLFARWKTGHIFRLALAESVALFGFALHMCGGSSTPVDLLYAGGLLLLLIWQPGAVPAQTEP